MHGCCLLCVAGKELERAASPLVLLSSLRLPTSNSGTRGTQWRLQGSQPTTIRHTLPLSSRPMDHMGKIAKAACCRLAAALG